MFAGGFQQFAKLLEFVLTQVGKLLAMHGQDGFVEVFEEAEGGVGDGGFDDSAVGGVALAMDEAGFFHAIEEAGDVGVAGDHAGADFVTGEAGLVAAGVGTAEDAEDVVLGGGEADGFEEGVHAFGEGFGGTHEVQEDFLLTTVEGFGLANFVH